MSEILTQIFSESIKLFVSGILGGIVGSFLSLRLYKSQKRIDSKYADQARKRDALFDIIIILPWIHRDIRVDWESPMDETQTPQAHMLDLINRINYWKTLFLDDSKITDALHKLDSLIGVGKDSFYGENKIFQQYPSAIISEIEKAVKQRIIELNNS